MTTPLLDVRPGLTDKIVLVTGGLGGIGRACIIALLAHGARVAFTYADRRESAEAAEALVATNPSHLSAHALDLRSFASIQACMAQVLERWSHINILINNAAVGSATVTSYADDT